MANTSVSKSTARMFRYPRHNNANTTIRDLTGEVCLRLLAIANDINCWTTANYTTWAQCRDALAKKLSVKPSTLDKLLLFGEMLGLLERRRPDRTKNKLKENGFDSLLDSLFDGENEDEDEPWVVLHPVGEAFLTTNDPVGALAHLMVLMVVKASDDKQTKLVRPGVAALRFLDQTGERGANTIEYTVYCASGGRETPTAQIMKKLHQHRNSEAGDSEMFHELIWKHPDNQDTKRTMAQAVKQILKDTTDNVEAQLDSYRNILVPGIKDDAWPQARNLLAETLSSGYNGVMDVLRDLVCTRTAKSILDMNQAFLNWMAHVGLIDKQGTGLDAVWTITGFGREALNGQPSRPAKTVKAAMEDMRSLVDFEFTDRTTTSRQKFDARVKELRTDPTKDGVWDDLTWARWEGLNQTHCYEWAVLLAAVCCLEVAEKWNPLDPNWGLRTQLNYNLKPTRPAFGGGSDGYVLTKNGLTVAIEATGVTGRNQISKEFESCARHLRELHETTDSGVLVFVAPEINPRFVSYWLGSVTFENPQQPGFLVPLNEKQMRKMAENQIDLEVLCYWVMEATEQIKQEYIDKHDAGWSMPAAGALLEQIDEFITQAVLNKRQENELVLTRQPLAITA